MKNGDGVPDPSFWFQSVLYEGHRSARDNNDRYLPIYSAIRDSSGYRAYYRHNFPGDRPLATKIDGGVKDLICLNG